MPNDGPVHQKAGTERAKNDLRSSPLPTMIINLDCGQFARHKCLLWNTCKEGIHGAKHDVYMKCIHKRVE